MLIPALILALTAVPASALKPASCLHPASGSAPTSLDALRACQTKARAAVVAAAARKGTPLTAAQLDLLDDAQRAEARKFFSQPQNVASADLARADPKSGAAVAGLQTRLQAAAGDGSNGVTPAMAGDIQATLLQSQGSVSPDMQSLLDSVSRDGAKLTPETMKKLQGAGREAKGQGLDLNIDPDTEKQLLNHDFESDKPAYDAAQPPGSM